MELTELWLEFYNVQTWPHSPWSCFWQLTISPLGSQGACFSLCSSSTKPPIQCSHWEVQPGHGHQDSLSTWGWADITRLGSEVTCKEESKTPLLIRAWRTSAGSQGAARKLGGRWQSRRAIALRNGIEVQLPRKEQSSHEIDLWKDRQTCALSIHSLTRCLTLDK